MPSLSGRGVRRLLSCLLIAAATPLALPQALAFPYRTTLGGTVIRSDRPIPVAMRQVLARADRLQAASAMGATQVDATVYLTDGGWRWRWLALTTGGAFAVSRPLVGTIVLNANDPTGDRIFNGRVVGGVRSLSGVIAHERCHHWMVRRYGPIGERRMPAWAREGYCDVVAGGGALSDAEARMVRRTDPDHPALFYYDGRRRVEAMLTRMNNDADRVLAAAR